MAHKNRDKRGRFAKVPDRPAPFTPDQQGYTAGLDKPVKEFVGNPVIPPHLAYAAIWNAISQSYRTLDDEAKRQNYQNALAMRRDAFCMKLLRARQYPTVELPFTIEVENPDDPRQKEVAEDLKLMINAIPSFHYLKLNLLEAIWFGKAGVQLTWDYRKINGKKRLIPVSHDAVNGDKLVFKWNRTPGVLIYKPYHPDGADIEQTNWGPALWLNDPFYRDRFIIHSYEPDDTDYLFESDLAGGRFGVGLRSRIYYIYVIRKEVLGWITDGLQRVSTNGMLVAYYPSGNTNAQLAAVKVLEDLVAKSVAAFPVDPGHENVSRIEPVSPATIAYDTQLKVVEYFDKIIELLFIGQELSSGTESTGMGSEVANLHALTLERVIRMDALGLSETLTRDLLQPMIKYNFGELDFNVRLKLQVEKTNVKDQTVAAKALVDMGVALDEESLRDMSGFVAPKGESQTIDVNTSESFRVGEQDKVGDVTTQTGLED